jgi:hypothetical protein
MDLAQLLRPRKISLIMPSISVVGILPHWLRTIGQSLTSLSLIFKACIFRLRAFDSVIYPIGQGNIFVTDSFLEDISQYLSQLEHLNLAGCRRVTNDGVWSIIRHNVRNIKELSLEGPFPLFASFIFLTST